MRQFTLKNSIGEVYRLNSSDNFFHTPEGLGFQRNATFQKLGTTYKLIRDGFRQAPVSGQIMFKTDAQASAYKRYLAFKNFLQMIPLTMVYQIPGGEFCMDCVPSTIEKTEINSALGMNIGIELTPLTMWYEEIEKEADSSSITVISDSLNDSPCCLSFSGVSKTEQDLTWTQSVDGVSVMTGTLKSVTIAASDTVYVRTDTDPYSLYKISSGGTKTGLYQSSNFSTQRFPFIQKGVNVFSVTGATHISVKGRILYETV